MTSNDDRNHSDCSRAKAEIREIQHERELVDQNPMKLLGRGHFACCPKWTAWGEGKGRWLSPWSIGQGSEFVYTIDENLGLRPAYLKDQDK
jgi:hypothetical protein